MKQWNITITAENETEALNLIKVLSETFKLASKIQEPLHHIYADMKGQHGEAIICEENTNFNK